MVNTSEGRPPQHQTQMKLFNAIAAAAVIGTSFLFAEKVNAGTMIPYCTDSLEQSVSKSRARTICQTFYHYKDQYGLHGTSASSIWKGANAEYNLGIDPAMVYKKVCNSSKGYWSDNYYCDPVDRKFASRTKRTYVPSKSTNRQPNSGSSTRTNTNQASSSPRVVTQNRCPAGTRYHKIKVGGLIKRTAAEGCFTDFQASQLKMQANANQQQRIRNFQRNLNESFPDPVNCYGTVNSFGGGYNTYNATCY